MYKQIVIKQILLVYQQHKISFAKSLVYDEYVLPK